MGGVKRRESLQRRHVVGGPDADRDGSGRGWGSVAYGVSSRGPISRLSGLALQVRQAGVDEGFEKLCMTFKVSGAIRSAQPDSRTLCGYC